MVPAGTSEDQKLVLKLAQIAALISELKLFILFLVPLFKSHLHVN